MGPFRFRAAAALEVRCRQERAAERALVHAEAQFAAAKRAQEAAWRQIRDAGEAMEAATRVGTDAQTIFWHRNWITRLTVAAAERGEQCTRLDGATVQARMVWQAAKRRRLMLERLRDRALRRHREAEHRQELKHLDELARVRFAMPPAGTERSQE